MTVSSEDPYQVTVEGGAGGSRWVDPSALDVSGFLPGQRDMWGYLDIRWRYDD